MNYSLNDIIGVLPETIVVITALLAIVVDISARGRNQSASAVITGIGFTVSGIAAVFSFGGESTIMGHVVYADGFTSVFRVLFCIIGLFTVLFSPLYMKRENIRLGEYYSLLAMCVLGMMVMVSAADLLLFFLGLETMSIALYVLAGIQRQDVRSVESGMKYLVMGAFASAFVLYGIALIYGGVGGIRYTEIASYVAGAKYLGPMTLSGMALLLVGFLFKIAAVPFHFWSPDVYEGAPTTITGFMSTGPKAAAFVALIRLFGITMAPAADNWALALAWIAVLTMTVGNVVALRQTSIKRMLAYSSVAHAGYLLVGIVAGTDAAFAAAGFYLIAYALMNLGAFAVIYLLSYRTNGEYNYDSLRGMGFSNPALGITMTIFMLSLTGMPPTAGFFGKLYVFSAAIEQGWILLAIAGLLNSAIAAYYYLRIIALLYMSKSDTDSVVPQPISYTAALIISSILILLLGIFPEQLVLMMSSVVP